MTWIMGDGRPRKIRRKNKKFFLSAVLSDAFGYLSRMLQGLDHWFATEVLPHERLLQRYLLRVWRNPSEVADLVQEVYVRVYERARDQRPKLPKAFLFATARNLMTDHLRRSRVVSIDTELEVEGIEVLVDELSPERHLSARQDLGRLALAFDSLSDKCRDVVWLRRVEGLSQRETADRMGLKEEAIESQLSRGIRALARAIFAAANESDSPASKARIPYESEQ
jgi:RNA polymerase sigma factor (sigma-70 family)